MLFDLLVLGIGALSRKIKDDNIRAEGYKHLKEREAKPVWEQAKEFSAMITINGIDHSFITPHEIYLNERYWNSGLSLDDFCVQFYIDHNEHWVSSIPRMFEKDGTYQMISEFDVVMLYHDYQKSGKIKRLYNPKKLK